MWKETVQLTGPYDFDRILPRLASDPINQVNVDKRQVRVPLRVDNQLVIVEVEGVGSIDKPQFIVSSQTSFKEKSLNKIKQIFKWDDSLQQVSEHFKQTNLNRLFEAHKGTPFVCEFDLYACLMKCIIHQQLNLTFAHTLTDRFVKTFGTCIDDVWFYPTPDIVAQLEVSQLRELQFSGRKAEYIIETSQRIVNGKLSLDFLRELPDEEVIETLVKIRGIGPWTAQNFLMFGLGRPNLLPLADIGIQNALKTYFQLEAKPSKEEIIELSKEWEPYLSYAALYLWRSIENE